MSVVSIRDETEDKSQLLLDLLKNSFVSAKFTGKAVWVGLLTSLGSSAVVFALFCILRPRNTIIYAPKTRLGRATNAMSIASSSSPPRLQPGIFGWMRQIYNLSEHQLLDIMGLDMVVYLKFMHMCSYIFLCLSFLGIVVAIPINVTFSLRNAAASAVSASDAFLLMTPTLVSGKPMIVHVVLAYIFDGIVCFFLWRTYGQVIHLRRRYFASTEYSQSLYARSVLVTEIAKKHRSNSGLATILMSTKEPCKVDQVSIGRSITGLGSLVEKREKYVLKLERVLAKYLKHPDNMPMSRPMCHPDKSDRTASGGKVDAIDYLIGRIQDLESRIVTDRKNIDSRKEMPYGFASYATTADAHKVAQANESSTVLGSARLHLAPRREDILWDNIVLTRQERLQKQHTGNLLFFVLCVSWIVPNAFIGTFLSQISRIGVLWDSFGAYMNRHPSMFSFIQGFISPAVTSAIFLILPVIMRRMSDWQGALTKSYRERNTLRKLYIFFVFNNLFIFTIFGVAWSAVTQLIQLSRSGTQLTAKEIFKSLAVGKQVSNSIIGVSSFWVMYIIRVNFGSVLDLMQVSGLLIRSFARKFLAPTPRQMIRWTAPPAFEYAAYYNWLLFYITIALAFTTIQPLVLLVTAFYFILDSFLKRYSFLYVFVTKVESAGAFWPDLFNRVLFACSLGNLVMLLVTWTQGGWRVAVGMLPLFPAILGFKIFCSQTFDKALKYDMADVQVDELQTWNTGKTTADQDLRVEFGSPALYRRLILPMVKQTAEPFLSDIYHGRSFGGEYTERRTTIADGAFEIVDDNQLDIVKFVGDPNFEPSDKPDASAVAKSEQESEHRPLENVNPNSCAVRKPIPSRTGSMASENVDARGPFMTPGVRNLTIPTEFEPTTHGTLPNSWSSDGHYANPYEAAEDDYVIGSSFPATADNAETKVPDRARRSTRGRRGDTGDDGYELLR
ncbi:hypothetical protein POJ06DRAFT_225501 [Lipomyces tetrasporus]|uniref:DUF221-domain-containing protein n=1 Tax=Lipomyces tetrasporus TaxID=54092 RepID=A0AAD7QNR0_9ASCO|nr:uncharacterized protein POJ06DRAFT_225501 [Lipomyces tetrasporus]KAJ8098653.1 hypothetical protein POJ06DRAFT_225501 [Lipomyces tetrasporus]